MNKLLTLVCMTLLLQGCASSLVGADNSFGAQASRHVKQTLSYDMCPYGTKSSRAQAASRTEVSKESSAQYRDSVDVYEEFRGRRTDECLSKPASAPAPAALPAAKKKQ